MTNVTLFGDANCHKTNIYIKALDGHNIDYAFLDVTADANAAAQLRALFADGGLKFPTLLIGGKVMRNPTLGDLDKALARHEIIDLGTRHEPDSNRFVRYMMPRDAFVSYSQNGGRMTLTHIEIPPERRGTGLGARLALEVFTMVEEMGVQARVTCTFMRRVALSRPKWAAFFGLA